MLKKFEVNVCDRCGVAKPPEELVPMSLAVDGEIVFEKEEICPRCVSTLKSRLDKWAAYVKRSR